MSVVSVASVAVAAAAGVVGVGVIAVAASACVRYTCLDIGSTAQASRAGGSSTLGRNILHVASEGPMYRKREVVSLGMKGENNSCCSSYPVELRILIPMPLHLQVETT